MRALRCIIWRVLSHDVPQLHGSMLVGRLREEEDGSTQHYPDQSFDAETRWQSSHRCGAIPTSLSDYQLWRISVAITLYAIVNIRES
jgi:hypothetical protein